MSELDLQHPHSTLKKNKSWKHAGTAYYPVRVGGGDGDKAEEEEEGSFQKGYFCNSGYPNFWAHGRKTFEGTYVCHATTPRGQAVACPMPLMHKSRHSRSSNKNSTTTSTAGSTPNNTTTNNNTTIVVDDGCREACDFSSDSCHVVYVGHNLLGNEMHWLPQRYLSNWWKSDYLASTPSVYASSFVHDVEAEAPKDKIQAYLQTLAPVDRAWCPFLKKSRPALGDDYQGYAQCAVTLGLVVDKEAFLTVQARHYHPLTTTVTTTSTPRNDTLAAQLPQHLHDYMDWSHIYASMPVLRTTILREPFSWLVSKYFWHRGPSKCDDVKMATMPISPFTGNGKHARRGGWVNQYALNYIEYLCGGDCAARYYQGIGNLQQMERQAANNLRQSFAVVGLLQETDTFYDMVTKRVQYANMSLNPHVKGAAHSTGNKAEQQRCKARFSNSTFQELLKQKSPILAALDRLYKVGVEVNRFQLEELQSCPTTTRA
jgi:hypothetical protein